MPNIDVNYKAPAGRSHSSNSIITLVATPKDKIPPQAGMIIECLLKAKDHPMTVAEMVGKDESGNGSALDAAGLKTVQTPRKVWQYYKGRLIDEKLITVS